MNAIHARSQLRYWPTVVRSVWYSAHAGGARKPLDCLWNSIRLRSQSGRGRQALPEAPYVECVERFIVADERNVLNLALRYEHSVEGIPMGSWQTAGTLGVEQRDVERNEALTGDAGGYVRGHISRARQLAQTRLRCDLPGRSGADQDRVRFVGDSATRLERKPAIAIQPPEKRMGIQQQAHRYSQSLSSRSGNDSKKARVTLARPRIAPNRRAGRTGRSLVRRATGVDPRAMMTSSPFSARSTSRESWVLAA